MKREFEIYYRDLNVTAKERLLQEFETSEEEENWEVMPLAVIEREMIDGEYVEVSGTE